MAGMLAPKRPWTGSVWTSEVAYDMLCGTSMLVSWMRRGEPGQLCGSFDVEGEEAQRTVSAAVTSRTKSLTL